MAVGWATVGNAGEADQDPGGAGLSTASRTLQTAVMAEDPQALVMGSPEMHGSDAAAPGVFIGLVIAFVLLKFVAEESGKESEFSNIRIGFFNILVITVAAVIGLTFSKYALTRVRIPGLSDLVKAA